jgi:hypothetical protein
MLEITGNAIRKPGSFKLNATELRQLMEFLLQPVKSRSGNGTATVGRHLILPKTLDGPAVHANNSKTLENNIDLKINFNISNSPADTSLLETGVKKRVPEHAYQDNYLLMKKAGLHGGTDGASKSWQLQKKGDKKHIRMILPVPVDGRIIGLPHYVNSFENRGPGLEAHKIPLLSIPYRGVPLRSDPARKAFDMHRHLGPNVHEKLLYTAPPLNNGVDSMMASFANHQVPHHHSFYEGEQPAETYMHLDQSKPDNSNHLYQIIKNQPPSYSVHQMPKDLPLSLASAIASSIPQEPSKDTVNNMEEGQTERQSNTSSPKSVRINQAIVDSSEFDDQDAENGKGMTLPYELLDSAVAKAARAYTQALLDQIDYLRDKLRDCEEKRYLINRSEGMTKTWREPLHLHRASANHASLFAFGDELKKKENNNHDKKEQSSALKDIKAVPVLKREHSSVDSIGGLKVKSMEYRTPGRMMSGEADFESPELVVKKIKEEYKAGSTGIGLPLNKRKYAAAEDEHMKRKALDRVSSRFFTKQHVQFMSSQDAEVQHTKRHNTRKQQGREAQHQAGKKEQASLANRESKDNVPRIQRSEEFELMSEELDDQAFNVTNSVPRGVQDQDHVVKANVLNATLNKQGLVKEPESERSDNRAVLSTTSMKGKLAALNEAAKNAKGTTAKRIIPGNSSPAATTTSIKKTADTTVVVTPLPTSVGFPKATEYPQTTTGVGQGPSSAILPKQTEFTKEVDTDSTTKYQGKLTESAASTVGQAGSSLAVTAAKRSAQEAESSSTTLTTSRVSTAVHLTTNTDSATSRQTTDHFRPNDVTTAGSLKQTSQHLTMLSSQTTKSVAQLQLQSALGQATTTVSVAPAKANAGTSKTSTTSPKERQPPLE